MKDEGMEYFAKNDCNGICGNCGHSAYVVIYVRICTNTPESRMSHLQSGSSKQSVVGYSITVQNKIHFLFWGISKVFITFFVN